MSGGLSSPQQLHPWTRRQSTECHPARCSPEQTRDRGSWPLLRASGASEAQHFVKIILVMGPPPKLLLAVRVVPALALAPPNPQPGASVASGGATTVNAGCAEPTGGGGKGSTRVGARRPIRALCELGASACVLFAWTLCRQNRAAAEVGRRLLAACPAPSEARSRADPGRLPCITKSAPLSLLPGEPDACRTPAGWWLAALEPPRGASRGHPDSRQWFPASCRATITRLVPERRSVSYSTR